MPTRPKRRLACLPAASCARRSRAAPTWYLQRQEGQRKRQHYVGAESDALLSWIANVREARSLQAADDANRVGLCRMLGAGGALVEAGAVVKVLRLLAES